MASQDAREQKAAVERGPAPSSVDWSRQDTLALAGLTLVWAASISWIDPRGEFPLSDDWAYYYTVRGLIEEGVYRSLPWTWVPAVSNAAWGALFAQVFGLSFETLRASSLVMGWLGVAGGYALARQLGADRTPALLAAAIVGFNPLSLPLSFTFMTDSAFAVFVTWFLYFIARALPGLRPVPLAAAVVLAAAAALSRQPGMGLFVCLALFALARWPSKLGWCALIAALVLVSWLGFDARLQRGFLALNWYMRKVLGEPRSALFALARNAVVIGYLFGAMLAPLVLASAAAVLGSRAAKWMAAVSAVAGMALVAVGLRVFDFAPGPPGVDWLHDFGIGPAVARDIAALPSMGPGIWLAGGLIGGAASGAGLVVVASLLWRRREATVWPGAVIASGFVALYMLALAIRHPFFDRYLVAVIPAGAALLAAASPGRLRWGPGLAVVAVALPVWLFGLAGTHDWMERERGRWRLLDELLAKQISPARIDGGGVSFNGHYNYHDASIGRRFVDDDEWIVSSAPAIDGYAVVRRDVHRAALPPGERVVYVHVRRARPESLEVRPPNEP